MKKPSCTKFVASWLASPIHLQDKISIAIKKAGAKDAYPVCVAKGTEMIIDG